MLSNDPDALPGEAASWAPGEPVVPAKDNFNATKVTSELANVQREKIAASDKVLDQVTSAQDRMLPRIEQLSKTVGVEAQSLKPWNADEETAKRRTDPIEAFGSFGSVFGIIASAFTNAPMENALNASAAAMNAIRANDDKGYDRAYKAWQDNTKQALDRHKIQHDAYQDAVSLLNVNMSAANTKMQVLAARFGDKQVLTMLEAGMSKEVQDILQSRQKMALELQQQMPKIMLENEKMRDLMEDPRMKQDVGAPERAQAIKEHGERWSGRNKTAVDQFIERFNRENPNATSQEFSDAIGDFTRGQRAISTDQEIIQTLRDEHEAAGKPAPTAAEIAAAVATAKRGGAAGGNTSLTGARQRAADVAAYREELKAEKNEDGSPKYSATQIADMAAKRERELNTSAASLSSGARVKVETAINNVTTAEKVLADMEELLKRKGITGFAGALARRGETFANILGANSSDYHEFAALHATLKRMMPAIITGSNSTRFKQEISEMDKIVAGTQMGDTLPSVAANYKKLREIFNKIKPDLDRIRKGEDAPINPGPSNAAPTGGSRPWERAPIKVPAQRSSIEPESETA